MNIAFAGEAAEVATQNEMIGLLPFLLIFGLFYFMLIRPQMKKQKEVAEMVKGTSKGDKIVTQGGLFGEVVRTYEEGGNEIAVIEIAEGIKVKILKSAIVENFTKRSATKANTDKTSSNDDNKISVIEADGVKAKVSKSSSKPANN